MKMTRWFLAMILITAPAFSASGETVSVASYSDEDLRQMAGDKYASGELPLGDNHYVLKSNEAPRKGYIYLCRKFGQEGAGGAQHAGAWIHGQTWNIKEKPSVQGHVKWDQARFSAKHSGNENIIEGNGLPISHTTGIFPIQPNDPASAYDRNPNSIQPQDIRERLPAEPVYSETPYCMGMEVGYMLTGVQLFNGFDAGLRDAAAHEVQDACQGHPQREGSYHYHSLSSCIRDVSVKTIIGYALDGFPITGPAVMQGKYLTTDNLDVCHGLVSEIIDNGQKKVTYHYVMTEDFPYSVSCFRAKPVRTGPLHSSQQPNMRTERASTIQPRRPPPEAINSCSGKKDGDTCGFLSPRGDQISGTCHAPPQSTMACIPAGRP